MELARTILQTALDSAPMKQPARRLTDLRHYLVREFVERGHSQFKMLFFRVLDLVVTDPAHTLDKHHYGRNSGAGHFGGIVQWPGW